MTGGGEFLTARGCGDGLRAGGRRIVDGGGRLFLVGED